MTTIAEKMKTIAENMDKLYEAGRNNVIDPDKIIEAAATGIGSVYLNDVSEVKHKVKIKTTAGAKVKVHGKNLFDVNSVSYLAFSSSDTSGTKGYQENGILYAFQGTYAAAGYWKGFILNLTPGVYTISCDAYTNMNDTESVEARFIDIDTNKRINPIGAIGKSITKGKKDRFTWTINVTEKRNLGLSLQGSGNKNNFDNLDVQFSNIQIEAGDFATHYEPYIEPREYTADFNGIVLVDSISRFMTVVSDAVEITAEYRRSWGMQAEYDRFWDAYQDYGNRTSYDRAFAGIGWTDETFKPKYKINIVNSAYMTFANAMISEITREIVDFSNCSSYNYTFYYQNAFRNVEMDCTLAMSLNDMFQLEIMESIKLFNVTNKAFFRRAFGTKQCTTMTTLLVDGVIAQNGFDVKHIPNLSHESLMSIINCLEDKTNDTSGTEWVVTLGDVNIAKLTSEEQEIAYDKGWVLG